MFFGHVALGEATVTGVTGRTRLKDSPAPVTLVPERELRQTATSNIVTALAKQPGVAAITTGSGIAKPVIRGLGYNRIVCLADGIRQEGQQWGDEHGLELDGSAVRSVEILKGPASLMYGSDAMAGVVIFHPAPVRPEGTQGGAFSAEYQTNSGLFGYTLDFAGNRSGFVWDARWSQRLAHAYKNKYDGYVPGSQFREQAFRTLLGLDKGWGHSHLTLGYYRLTPGIVEGERDSDSGVLEADEGWRGISYGRTLPFQEVYHYKAVLDNSLRLTSGTLTAIVGYQQNRRQEFEGSPTDYELYFKQHTLTYDMRFLAAERAGWKVAGGLGGMYQRSLNKGEEVLIPAYRLFDIGVFATGSRRIGQLNVSGGVRYDVRRLHSEALEDDGRLRFGDFRRTFSGLTGSLGAVWQAGRDFNVRLNVARGFRAPNLAELGSNGVHEGTARYEMGNSGLRAERSWQADLGADYLNSYFSVQVALFVSRIDNYIYLRRTSDALSPSGDDAGAAVYPLPAADWDGPVYQYACGDARLYGFEAGLDFHPIHSL
ncbi:MAG: TonB-dependent receptor, partial [Alloprevotella sp.]|nr:TonB-dependent receptor [Alloprevotella sp.]